MSKAKFTYFAVAHNDSGASVDVENSGGGSLRTNSLRAIEDAARSQLGKGWQVKVWGIQHDGDNGWFPPVEIKTWRIKG